MNRRSTNGPALAATAAAVLIAIAGGARGQADGSSGSASAGYGDRAYGAHSAVCASEQYPDGDDCWGDADDWIDSITEEDVPYPGSNQEFGPDPYGGYPPPPGQYPSPGHGQQYSQQAGQYRPPGYGGQQHPQQPGQYPPPGYGQQYPQQAGQYPPPGYAQQYPQQPGQYPPPGYAQQYPQQPGQYPPPGYAQQYPQQPGQYPPPAYGQQYPQQPGRYPPPGYGQQQPGQPYPPPQPGAAALAATPSGQLPGPLPTRDDVPEGRNPMMDVNGFEHPVPAYHFERPEGWRVDEASIAWSEQPCAGMAPMERLRLSGPDGQTIESGGLEGWAQGIETVRANMRRMGVTPPPMIESCPERPIVGAAQHIETLAAARRPGMRVTARRDRTDLVRKELRKYEEQYAQFSTETTRQAIDAMDLEIAELRIEWDGPSGPTEEMLLLGLGTLSIPDSDVRMQVSTGLLSLSAPKGKLDPELLERVGDSVEPLPAYQALELAKTQELERAAEVQDRATMQALQARMDAYRQRRSGGRLLTGTGAPPTGIGGATPGSGGGSTAAYEARMQAMDRVSIGTSDALTDTTTVFDAWNGHDVAVDGHGDVWQNDATGEIFTTSPDSYYDPSADGISATQLDPVSTSGDASDWTSAITD